jgi:membrane protease subunit HflK
MNHDHDHPHSHEHGPEHGHEPEPVTVPPLAEDSGSQALEEAMRSSFFIVKVAMFLMVVAFLASGFFTVGAAEKAVILRFGKPVGEGQRALLTSGLHWAFPYPIDEVVKIPITEIQKTTSTTGWYFTTPEQELSGEEPPAGPSLNPAIDGYVLTADHNIIHTRATLYYHIDDPLQYVFEFSNAALIVQNTLNTALLRTAAQYNVDDILQRDQAGFKDAVQLLVTQLADQEKLGISIDNCEVQSIPPRQLKDVFSQVTTARENRDKLLIDAQSQRNQVLSQAGANAVTITNLAAADRDNYVKSLIAEAKRLPDLLPQFTNHPNLFAQQQLVAAMAMALTNVQDVHFQTSDGRPSETRLMLNREPPQPKQAAGNP